MEIFSNILTTTLDEIFELLINTWWYWLSVGLGILYRMQEIRSRYLDSTLCFKVVIREIGIVIILTYGWMGLETKGAKDNLVIAVLILTAFYIFNGIAQSCDETGGTTESILLIIKYTFVTMLSFQGLETTIIMVCITICLSWLAFKYVYQRKKIRFSRNYNTMCRIFYFISIRDRN